MNPIDSILQNMSQFVKHQPKEVLGLTDTFGRILAEPLISPHAFPVYDEAAKTGFAVRLSDINELPVSLKLVGTSNHSIPYTDPINNGETVLLYKHSPLPPNTDAVVPMEYTDITAYLENGSYKPKLGDDIIIDREVTLGANISMQGIDFDDEEVVVEEGSSVTSRVVSLAATMHIPWLTVRRQPRVGILAVGSELKMLGDPGSRGAVISSSSYSLKCAITACGGIPVNIGIVKDNPEEIEEVISGTAGLDFLITTGGTSLSANNLLLNALANNEDSMIYKEQVVIDEGEVVIYGNYGDMPFLSLPGNLCGSLILSTLLINPLIRYMSGNKELKLVTEEAILGRNLDAYDVKHHFLHSKLIDKDGKLIIEPMSGQDKVMISHLTTSDALLILDDNIVHKAGDIMNIVKFSGSDFVEL